MEGVSVVGFGAEVEIRGRKLFGLTQEKVSAGLEVKVQAFEQRDTLRAGKMRQNVHAEDAVEASDVDGLGQAHGVEGDQAAQARLNQQVRAI